MEEEESKREKEIGKLLTEIDSLAEKRYGLGVKDALNRIETINQELGTVKETVQSNKTVLAVLDDRTKGTRTLIYALLVGVFGTLISIILTVVQLLP